MKTKRSIIKKLVCLTAIFTMLIGSAMSVSAEEGMTAYFKADGTYTFVADSQVPAVGTNGLPLYRKEYTKTVVEVSSLTPGGVYIYSDWSTLYTPEQIALLYSIIDASGITNEMSKYDKAVALNNAECAVMHYDLYQHSMYGDGLYCVQMGGGGACGNYADLYQTLCQAVGIDCQIISGKSGSDSHAWNVMMINGKEYYNDVTWNDTESGMNSYLMRETPIHEEICRSTTPEGAQTIYFPTEYRTVQNYGPADAPRFNLLNMEVASQESFDEFNASLQSGENPCGKAYTKIY